MTDLPARIETCRRHGLEVSDDGFYSTPTGPAHIDDSALGRVLLAHDDLVAALRGMVEMFEHRICNRPGPVDAAYRWDVARAAIAKAEGTK
jgi:hypothetical protein